MDKDLDILNEIKQIRSILKDMDKRLENIEETIIDKESFFSEKGTCINYMSKDLDIEDIWNKAKDIIKAELTEVTFNTWIKPITQCDIKQDTLYLKAPNDFSKGILEARYQKLIKQAVKHITGYFFNIKFVVKEDTNTYNLNTIIKC